jgi:hypothetical protein
VGSTGNLPVPGGYQPRGTGTATKLFLTNDSNLDSFPIPSGQWPDGTGGLPVPPIFISKFEFNAKARRSKDAGNSKFYFSLRSLRSLRLCVKKAGELKI